MDGRLKFTASAFNHLRVCPQSWCQELLLCLPFFATVLLLSLMLCLEKILARVVSCCLLRGLRFGVSFFHDGRVTYKEMKCMMKHKRIMNPSAHQSINKHLCYYTGCHFPICIFLPAQNSIWLQIPPSARSTSVNTKIIQIVGVFEYRYVTRSNWTTLSGSLSTS